MIKIIWLITAIAAVTGWLTMRIPSKLAYVLTWILFGIVVLGTTLLMILLFGGTIYL